MIINRENFEAFLLDLMEGNLSMEQENNLRHFLIENPDLAIEVSLSDIKLPVIGKFPLDVPGFPLKEELKKGGLNKEINEGNYEQFCIARLEGDLSVRDENRLEIFLFENPDLQKSAETFGYTILKAENSVVFMEKYLLRKGITSTVKLKEYFKKSFIYRVVSIAASVAIMISVFNLVSDNFLTEQTINQGNKNVIISEDQVVTQGSDAVAATDTSPEESSVETTNVGAAEFREVIKPGNSVILQPVTRENQPEVSHQLASRETFLLPVKIIIPVQVKPIPTDFYAEIVRPEQIAISLRDQTNTENERSGAGMILDGLLAFATRNVDENTDSAGLNLWNIADAGFKGINSLTGADLRLEREFNQEGELVSMAFSSRVLEFRRTSSSRDN